ncbi:MAG: fumarylacetoacetate hydrolase family protein, partial [Gemmatimonadota bacterium]|nr:fumarylacetoacetate hydrolase family protein [Gemmatimonadota bacterium]
MIDRPGKIVCVGRNYSEHAKELGNEVPKEPLLFLKPPSSVVRDGEAVVLPPQSTQVEHEGEIGVVLGTRLSNASPEEAANSIRGVCAL